MRRRMAMCGPSDSSPPQSCWCCAMIRFGSLMEPDQILKSLNQTEQNHQVRMGQSGKPFKEANSRTRRKRWKRWKNWCCLAHHPNARFLEWRFPSISNDLRLVPSQWLNVLTVRERVRSLRSRASSGSHRTSHAKSRSKFMASVGRPQEKRTGMWLEKSVICTNTWPNPALYTSQAYK